MLRKELFLNKLNNTNLAVLVLLFGALPFASSLLMEYIFGLKPCHLCLYQRYLHYAVAVVGLSLCEAVFDRPRLKTMLTVVVIAAYLVPGYLLRQGVDEAWTYLTILLTANFGILLFRLLKQSRHNVLITVSKISALIILCNMGVAFYHAGVEHKFWHGPSSCTADTLDPAASLDDIKQHILKAAVIPCDVPAIRILGLSLSELNLLLCIGLFVALYTRIKMEKAGDETAR